MDAEIALSRLSALLRSGGVLAVVGLARSSLGDLPIDVAAVLPDRIHRRCAPYWQHPSPIVWPPPESYTSMRGVATRVLRDARFRRRLSWRYTLVWTKPATAATVSRSSAPASGGRRAVRVGGGCTARARWAGPEAAGFRSPAWEQR